MYHIYPLHSVSSVPHTYPSLRGSSKVLRGSSKVLLAAPFFSLRGQCGEHLDGSLWIHQRKQTPVTCWTCWCPRETHFLVIESMIHVTCMFLCCATETRKEETWEDSEWGALPSCDQPQSVPPSGQLHRLHRLGHGPLHQEVVTIHVTILCELKGTLHLKIHIFPLTCSVVYQSR